MNVTIFRYLTPKTLLFGFSGALGALILALFAEPLIQLLPKVDDQKFKADVVFVIDATGSMTNEINGVKNGIKSFAHAFFAQNIDLNVGAVWFRDRMEDFNALNKVTFAGKDLTDDYDLFSRQIDTIIAFGGGDEPESSFDAIDFASTLAFRNDAQKILILVTDAGPKVTDFSGKTLDDVKNTLTNSRIAQLHLAINGEHESYYKPLQDVAAGEIFSLQDIGSGISSFEKAMPYIGEKIAKGVSAIASKNEKFAANAIVGVIAIFSIWWGCVAMGISALLAIAQDYYLKKPMNAKKWRLGSTIGFVIGLLVGVALQLFFVDPSDTAKIFAWASVGAGIGLAIAKMVVPNYPAVRALSGGLIGGLAGGISFILLAMLSSDTYSRLLGAAVVGFFIGLMIALFEEISREAWLTVDWGHNQKRTLSLGDKPIILGSSSEAQIYLPKEKGFLPVTSVIRMENNKVLYEDRVNKKVMELKDGKTLNFNSVIISIHTK